MVAGSVVAMISPCPVVVLALAFRGVQYTCRLALCDNRSAEQILWLIWHRLHLGGARMVMTICAGYFETL